MSSSDPVYILPSNNDESTRLEVQALIYGGTSFIDPFLDEAPESVLEIGSGTGHFANHCALRLANSRITGLDMDEARLAHARKHYVRPNLTFRKGDMFDLPYDDETFDLVFARFVLVHAPEPAVALREMRRAARKGGRVVAYDMVHDGVWFSPAKPAFDEVLKRTIQVLKKRGMELSQGLHLPGAMHRAGFRDVEVNVIPHALTATDPRLEQHRENWLMTMRGLDEIIGERIDSELVAKAVEELEERRPDDFLLELTVLAAGTR